MASGEGHRSTREVLVANTRVRIGRFTYGFESLKLVHFDAHASLEIGAFCSIATETTVFVSDEKMTHRQHAISTFPFGEIFQDDLGGTPALPDNELYHNRDGGVRIGNDVWLGRTITIMPGVRIGDGAVVAARSHVVKDVKPYEVVGGNPASHIKYRFDQQIRDLLSELRWWELPVSDIRAITSTLWRPPTVELLTSMIERYRDTPRYRF